MTTVAPKTRKPPSRAARRTGYVFSILINAALLFGINVWPGWDILPFLDSDFTQVLGLVNLSLWVSLAVQLVYLFRDARPVKPLGDVVTLAVNILVGVRMWQVFPFDFGDQTFDWELLFRILLVVGIVGMVIAIIVSLVSLVTGRPSQT